MPSIDGERLLDDLHTLRTFGASGTGVIRPTFSDADMAARRWLRDRMDTIGQTTTIDGVGNVVGRSPNAGPALIIGSHSDTQPRGGWLDGALGVIYAIETARAVADDPATRGLAIDTVAWSDEESTYTSFLGSSSFVGDLDDRRLQDANADGETVAAALERVGLATAARTRLDPTRHIAYIEPHIEQGPHLEDAGMRIGVVTSIVGVRSWRITFVGEQNHAGTTPMARRRDAGRSMFEFGFRVNERLSRSAAGPTSVWTIGNARVDPGAASIIPGFASLSLQFRDPDEATLDAIETEVLQLVDEMTRAGPVEVAAQRAGEPIAPADMDVDVRRHIARAAEARVPGGWIEMPSAAAHDAMVVCRHVPCAMLFIPSVGGISHDFAENSTDADIVTGCQVLADAAVSILTARSPDG